LVNSLVQTKDLSRSLAKDVLASRKQKKAIVIGLVGELGGGKTSFLQGFAKGLGIKEKILSPTFVLMRSFPIVKSKRFKRFFHLDCYRLNNVKGILDLGFKEIISNPENIVAIEWAEKLKQILPKNTIWIKFDFIDEKTRKITLKNIYG